MSNTLGAFPESNPASRIKSPIALTMFVKKEGDWVRERVRVPQNEIICFVNLKGSRVRNGPTPAQSDNAGMGVFIKGKEGVQMIDHNVVELLATLGSFFSERYILPSRDLPLKSIAGRIRNGMFDPRITGGHSFAERTNNRPSGFIL